MSRLNQLYLFFFFNDTATTEIYTLSLHDALPICRRPDSHQQAAPVQPEPRVKHRSDVRAGRVRREPRGGVLLQRSEEHTSELQSRLHLVCRLLLEKKKAPLTHHTTLYSSTRHRPS